MNRTIFASLSAFCLSGALAMSGALAEPKAPTEEENADANFAESFLGRTYSGDLEIEGWLNYGGGLVSPPIWISQYQREDGTNLVLTSRETAPDTRTSPATYVVTDALILPPPPKGLDLVISCTQGDDPTLRFIGEAKGPNEQEWWTDVRRAWEISIETGEITSVKAKGIKCSNISWGQ
jgi:hypothetical protein